MRSSCEIPEVTIELNGSVVSAEVSKSLEEVYVRQRLSRPALIQLTFFQTQHNSRLFSIFTPGMDLRIAVGGHSKDLFRGQITAVEYVYSPSREQHVLVRGYDRLHQLRKRQSIRAHVQVTLADLAREFVKDLGISVDSTESGPLWQRVIQHRQSDFDLLLERATLCGLHFFLNEDVLEILTLEGAGKPLPLALWESILEARLEVNADPVCRSVSTIGWDPLRVLELRGRTQSPRVGRRVETEVEPAKVGGTGQRTLVNEPVESADQAEAVAQAELDLRFAKEGTFWGVVEGDPHLHPGKAVEVQGIAAEVAGRYILADVIHTIDNKKGYTSELSSSPPLPRPRSRATVATLGIVTDVSDPDNLGRVKVSLPAFDDVGTDWLAIVTPGAGKNKGLIFIPNVDDRVLVLLNNEDPAQGVVVGGLYGSKTKPPDDGVVDNAVRRCTFLTAGGQRVLLDDEHGTIHLENHNGSYVEISPKKVHVHSKTELILEALGKQISIRGRKIDFKEA